MGDHTSHHAAGLRVPAGALTAFTAGVLRGCGVPAAHAELTAQRMVEADIQGKPGHGVFRLPAYVRRIRAGGYRLDPRVRLVHETPVSALVDGDNALGQVVMTFAAQVALRKAAAAGLAWVGVRNSNHAGAGGVYAAMALEQEMIGIYLAIGNANHLPPWGGADPLLSTNPVAVALPARRQPALLLDMATTVVSYGRVKLAAQRGEPLEPGWMAGRDGRPLLDSARYQEGFLLPIGGYKGYGLNLVIGALAGVLNGAAVGSATVDFNADDRTPTNTGHTIIVARPDLIRPLDEYYADMDRWLEELRSSRRQRATTPIRTPGDQMGERRAEASAAGVPVEAATADALAELADGLGLPHPFTRDAPEATAPERRSM